MIPVGLKKQLDAMSPQALRELVEAMKTEYPSAFGSDDKKKLSEVDCDFVTLSAVDKVTKECVSANLPVVKPSCGVPCVDVTGLFAKTGMYTFDPGFTGTSSCRSTVTYIDGPKGILTHRGYAIDELAAKSSYLEVCYLLLNDTLPSRRQLTMFQKEVTRRMTVPERLRTFVTGFPDSAHPMASMVGTVGALAAFYCNTISVNHMSEADRALAAVRVVAKLPTIAAMAYRHSKGLPFVYPRRDLSFAANFLHMCFASPLDQGADLFQKPPDAFVEAIDVFFLLHADHEQNASTSTVRLAGSSEANPFAAIASGIASLWGPRHGGANEAVISQLKAIGDASKIPEYLAKAKDKNDPFKLMGFGHRVYKARDPRAKEMRRLALACVAAREQIDNETRDQDAYLTSSFAVGPDNTNLTKSNLKEEETKEDTPSAASDLKRLFALATQLEEAALKDDYFVSRKLFPNVDFYSGLALTAIGIPTSMFTPLFAIGRSVGWITQWKEFIDDPDRKIGRPRQLYVGEPPRPFTSIDDREHRESLPVHFTHHASNPNIATDSGASYSFFF